MNLNNKVALITGGTHGIGAATALALAREGVQLALAARHPDKADIQQQLDALGATYITITADVSKPDDCKRIVEETANHFKGIDILIHAAGGAAPGGLLTGAADSWYFAFDVHVHAAFHLAQAAVPYMKEKKEGSITVISSAAGLRGVRNALAYATVKGALPQFTRALALELGDDNIRVNCVSPGVVRTRFQDYLTEAQVKNNIDNRIPLHREGKPEDVAEVILMLVKNEFITGENVVIDGGMTMRIV